MNARRRPTSEGPIILRIRKDLVAGDVTARSALLGAVAVVLAGTTAGCAHNLAAPLASTAASSTTTSLIPSIASSPAAAAASDSWAGYGEPCLATLATPVVNGQVVKAQTAGTFPTLHGPFTNIGVRFTVGGAKLLDARIDVVADPTSTPTALDPATGQQQNRELSAGTEAGLAARAVFTGFATGVFSLSLGSFDAALHLTPPAGTPSLNVATAPSGTTANAVVVATPAIASSYTVYLVEHLDAAACNGGSPADGVGIEPLATLIP
jgi:hypothetical protein